MDKQQQKQLLTEVMNEDANDGLYKQQTAVDWLVNQIHSEQYQYAFGQTYVSFGLIEQAKAMEKEQIIKAYAEGCADSILDESTDKIRSQKYYNETYNNEKNN